MLHQYMQLLNFKNLNSFFGTLMFISIIYIYPVNILNYNVGGIYKFCTLLLSYTCISTSLDSTLSFISPKNKYSNPSHYYVSALFVFAYSLLYIISIILPISKINIILDLCSYQLYFTQIVYKHRDMTLFNFNNIVDFYNKNSFKMFYITIPYCLFKKYSSDMYALPFLYVYLYLLIPIILVIPLNKSTDVINYTYTILNTKYNIFYIFEYLFNIFINFGKRCIALLYANSEQRLKIN